MQVNIQTLNKKAIDAALENNWQSAVELNEEILSKFPDNKEAKGRLGRAYIKTKQFSKAKKIYKEILEKDPINQIALKNFKLASEKNSDNKAETEQTKSTKLFIKEPGTTTQLIINAKKSILDKLEMGQDLILKSTKNSLKICYKDLSHEIGEAPENLAKTVYKARKEGKDITANVVKTNDDHLTVILKSKYSIFKSEKQQEKPFMKDGIIEEPEIEIEEFETPEE